MGDEENVGDTASGGLNAAMIADIVSRAVAATIASMPQPQQTAPPAQSPSSDKTPRSLKNTLCPEKLNCQTFTRKKYQARQNSFRSFVREAKIDTQGWDKKFTAFQTVMEPETFAKANSVRLQKDISEQTDFEVFLAILKELVEASRPVWVARQRFQKLKQGDESVRQFYSSITEIAEDCEFATEFCTQCKQKSIDQMITMKMGFDTKSEEARKEMLTKKKLTLEMAIKELESEETISKAHMEFQPESTVSRIKRRSNRPQSQRRHTSRSRY